jgi:hypothetical protein
MRWMALLTGSLALVYCLRNRIAFECEIMRIAKVRFHKKGPGLREDEAILFADLGCSKNVTPVDPQF